MISRGGVGRERERDEGGKGCRVARTERGKNFSPRFSLLVSALPPLPFRACFLPFLFRVFGCLSFALCARACNSEVFEKALSSKTFFFFFLFFFSAVPFVHGVLLALSVSGCLAFSGSARVTFLRLLASLFASCVVSARRLSFLKLRSRCYR